MLLNWYRTSFAPPSAPPLPPPPHTPPPIYEQLIPWKKIPESIGALNKYEQISKDDCYGILESTVQGTDFKRKIIYALFWLSEWLHFFPYDTIVNSVLDRRETQTGLWNDFLLVHPECSAELPDSQTRAPSMIKTGRRIESFSQSAGLWRRSLAKLSDPLRGLGDSIY